MMCGSGMNGNIGVYIVPATIRKESADCGEYSIYPLLMIRDGFFRSRSGQVPIRTITKASAKGD